MLRSDAFPAIDHRRNPHPVAHQRFDRAPAVVRARKDTDLSTRRHGIPREIRPHGRRQHHAGPVVSGKHDRSLDGACSEHGPARHNAPDPLTWLMHGRNRNVIVDALQRTVGPTVIGAEDARARHHCDLGERAQFFERGGDPRIAGLSIDQACVAEQSATEHSVRLGQDDARATSAGR